MANISVPNTFVNLVQIADATQVNANYNAITQGLANGAFDFYFGNVRIASALSADGPASFYSSVSFAGTAAFSGSVHYYSSVSYAGTATYSGGAVYNGAGQFNSSVSFADSATFSDPVYFGHNVQATSSVTFATNVTLSGHANIQGQKELRLYDSDSSNYVGVQAPATVGTNYTVALPQSSPTGPLRPLTYNNGTLSWASSTGTYSSQTISYTITDTDGIGHIELQGDSIQITMPTLADNIDRVISITYFQNTSPISATLPIIVGEGSETIDAQSSITLLPGASIVLKATAAQWKNINGFYNAFKTTSPTISNAGTSPSGTVIVERNGCRVTLWASITTGSSGSPTSQINFTDVIPTWAVLTNQTLSAIDISTAGNYMVFLTVSANDVSFLKRIWVDAADTIQNSNFGNSETFLGHLTYLFST